MTAELVVLLVVVASVVGLAAAAIAVVAWAVRQALQRGDRAAAADVAAAIAAGDARRWQALAETEARIRRSAQARAETLEQELADADAAAFDPGPAAGARRRVLSRWREAELDGAPDPAGAGGDRDPGAVPDPAAAAGDAGPVTRPGDDP